jgi:hypothetical protein
MLLTTFIGNTTWIISTYLLLLTIVIIREYFRRMQYAVTAKKFRYITLINFIFLFYLGFLFMHL